MDFNFGPFNYLVFVVKILVVVKCLVAFLMDLALYKCLLLLLLLKWLSGYQCVGSNPGLGTSPLERCNTKIASLHPGV